MQGAGSQYDPTRLITQGHVVVVTLNYRLGALGFLRTPALAADISAEICAELGRHATVADMVDVAPDELLAATAVMGLGNGLGSGAMMTLGADLAPKQAAGEFLGVWRLVGDAGQLSGPLVVGTVADAIGLGPAAYVLAVIGVFAAATLYLAVQETRTAAAAGPSPPAPLPTHRERGA